MNKKRNILIATAMSLVLTMCLAVTAEAGTETIPDNRDGFELQNGVTYRVTNNTSVTNLKVANNATVKIIIDQGVTLTARGSDGNGDGVGGNAGIYLPKGSTLILDGGGTLEAIGGNGGNGTDGTDGGRHYSAEWEDNIIEAIGGMGDADQYGGNGGIGGIGAGGGGAGIGTNGGNGAQPSSRVARGCAYDFDLCANGRNWSTGDRGLQGASTGDSGDVYNYGVTVKATGGNSGSAGSAGNGGKKYTLKPSYEVDFGLLGKLDVKETYICYGQGGGGGQSGNAGCAIGPGGGGGGSGHNGNGGAGQCSRNFAVTVKTLSYPASVNTPADGVTGASGNCGTYHVYDGTYFNGSSASYISSGSVGSDVDHMSYMTIDVKLDDKFYATNDVYLVNNQVGKVVLNKLSDTSVGQYFVYVHRDASAEYKIYVDGVYSGCTVSPNAETPATVTANYYTVSANILNGDAAWQDQTATLAGDGKVYPLYYQSTGQFAGKYTTILPLTDTTEYQLRVNGTAYENYIQVSNENKRTTEIKFFDATVTTNLDGNAATDIFSVMLKQNGKTVRVMDRDTQNSCFTAAGLLEGEYDVFIYGTSSEANKETTVSLNDSNKTFYYYTIHFIRNIGATPTDCRTQYRAAGDNITLASTPYIPGYTFAGWKTDAEGTADYIPGTAEAETFVYASWLKPQVTLGSSVRCDANGAVCGTGTSFRLPNLAVQGYPQNEAVIHTFTVNLDNVEEVGITGEEVTIDGKTWTRSTTTYDGESAYGIILYQAKTTDDYLTVEEIQTYLRSKVYRLKVDTQSGSIKLQTYGNTND